MPSEPENPERGLIRRRLHDLLGPGWQSFAGIFLVTNLGLLAVGATLPVIPRFVSEELGGTDLEVAIVTGAFALTGIVCRPLGRRRRRSPRAAGHGDRRRAARGARRVRCSSCRPASPA